jgi:hypothetical protein
MEHPDGGQVGAGLKVMVLSISADGAHQMTWCCIQKLRSNSGHRRRSDLLMEHPDGGQVGAGLEVMVAEEPAILPVQLHLDRRAAAHRLL